MKVLIDTSVWSIVLRRQPPKEANHLIIQALEGLIEDSRACLIGPIRQEILSGVSSEAQFTQLKNSLSAFPDIEILSSDYEKAAQFFNTCRTKGIQGSHIDFLICAIAHTQKYSIFTQDKDFSNYCKWLPIQLHAV